VDEEPDGDVVGSAVVETRWGVIGLVERSGAVVSLALADDEGAARDVLAERFPEAEAGACAGELAKEVARRIEMGEGFEGIPVEFTGTGFQEAVWKQLIRVPRGESVTYGELARRAGRPGASRAVGSACGANPVALLVPCHRVIPSDGSGGGFRWGSRRKVAILTEEGVTVEPPGIG